MHREKSRLRGEFDGHNDPGNIVICPHHQQIKGSSNEKSTRAVGRRVESVSVSTTPVTLEASVQLMGRLIS